MDRGDVLRRFISWALLLTMGAGAVYGLGWLAWAGMKSVSPDSARIWALMVTALLPLILWLGWTAGHFEASGRLAGIDQAVDRVMSAASQVAGLRTETRAARRAAVETTTVLLPLPQAEIVSRRQLLPSRDVVDL